VVRPVAGAPAAPPSLFRALAGVLSDPEFDDPADKVRGQWLAKGELQRALAGLVGLERRALKP